MLTRLGNNSDAVFVSLHVRLSLLVCVLFFSTCTFVSSGMRAVFLYMCVCLFWYACCGVAARQDSRYCSCRCRLVCAMMSFDDDAARQAIRYSSCKAILVCTDMHAVGDAARQAIRYCFSETSVPLWISSKGKVEIEKVRCWDTYCA